MQFLFQQGESITDIANYFDNTSAVDASLLGSQAMRFQSNDQTPGQDQLGINSSWIMGGQVLVSKSVP